SNSDFVEIVDSRIKGKLGIIDVRPDFNDRKFLIIVAGG
ncbi:TPA: phage head-tail adapter protein, partial [Streptococcus pyogenes]